MEGSGCQPHWRVLRHHHGACHRDETPAFRLKKRGVIEQRRTPPKSAMVRKPAVKADFVKGIAMGLNVYLSGEIHTDWRDQITEGAAGLDVPFRACHRSCARMIAAFTFSAPNRTSSGTTTRARTSMPFVRATALPPPMLSCSVRRQIQAVERRLRCRLCAALGKSLIIMHGPDHQHALKKLTQRRLP